MSKGSALRPKAISNEEYASRWDAIFAREHDQEKYCLGTGAMDKCNTCQNFSNWMKIQEVPNFHTLRNQMKRVDESYCQISSGKLYIEKKTETLQ